jgi:hypothetical protein
MSRAETSDVGERSYAPAVILALVLIAGLLLLPFVPLLLSLLEHATLGTQRVEDFCREIGIHDELSTFYGAVLFWLK